MNTKLFHEKIYPLFTPLEKQIKTMAEAHDDLSMLILQKYKKVCSCNRANDTDILNLEHMIKTWIKEKVK